MRIRDVLSVVSEPALLLALLAFPSCIFSWQHTRFLKQTPHYEGTPYSTDTKLFAQPPPENVDEICCPPGRASDEDLFDLNVALFCGGLAFDAYVEPPVNSTRWERGSKGMNVAFLSQAFTRSLYKGLVEITPIKCSGLPEEDDQLESLISGSGVDASIMVAAIEGKWKEDIELLKKEYHEGILDLSGAAHIGKSSTAWSNIDEKRSAAEKAKTGKAPPYHIGKSWGKDASAVWPDPDPFFLYVMDPANVQLLFTLFDDDVIGDGSAIGSTYISLSKILPQVSYSQDEIVNKLKAEIINKIRRGEATSDDIEEEVSKAVRAESLAWEGDLKLTSKPRIKNKNSQIAAGAAMGAFVAGPVGAALGAGLGSMYEGQVKGRITARIRYLPIPEAQPQRSRYNVAGGMPGINWGSLYEKFLAQHQSENVKDKQNPGGDDLEHCFFINHSETGGCCAVYRSLERKLIVVSFRGTCAPIDLVTDASIVQEPWVEGDDNQSPETAKVHVGFRRSLNSISRRLKELLLATVGPDDLLSDYDMLVTGHSLGGALATLFVADIGEYGIDAGRALPTTEKSDVWWKAITNTFMGGDEGSIGPSKEPPRPRSLRLYNFGSPRAGNRAFSKKFEDLIQRGLITQAYRVVNGKDVVARMPRTFGALSVDYDHCGKTVLVEAPTRENPAKVLWIENESDDTACPVRDFEQMTASPTADGTLLGDLLKAMKGDETKLKDDKNQRLLDQVGSVAAKFSERLSAVTAADITSLIGIDKSFTEREVQMVQALLKGEALAHHMEDSYYAAIGNAAGFVSLVGEEIVAASKESVSMLASEGEQDELALVLEELNANDGDFSAKGMMESLRVSLGGEEK